LVVTDAARSRRPRFDDERSVPHKDFSDLYEKMTGKGASTSEAHRVASQQRPHDVCVPLVCSDVERCPERAALRLDVGAPVHQQVHHICESVEGSVGQCGANLKITLLDRSTAV
jgi:hypothetical protein